VPFRCGAGLQACQTSVLAWLVLAAAAAAAGQPAPPTRISPHVYVIPPGGGASANVGVIVGDRATLIIDGGRSSAAEGRALARTIASLARGTDVFLVSTEFQRAESAQPEGFPGSVKVVRTRAQQQDVDEFAPGTLRAADVYFTSDYTLDLGGVEVQLLALGPAHTRGSIGVFVAGERVLFAGGVVTDRAFLSYASPYARPPAWLASLERLERLRPLRVIPRRGGSGTASMLEAAGAYIETVQARVAELSPSFESVDALVAQLTNELVEAYPDWSDRAEIAGAVTAAYAELRERD